MNDASSKPRIVYLHGDHVLFWDWGWVAKLASKLADDGYPIFFELFPDSIEARARYWLPFLQDHIRVTGGDVLLGWSCGAAAAMRFAQTHPVRGLVLVAPYYTDLGLAEVRRSGFVTEPWDWDAIRGNAGSVAIFHSDQDPFIPQTEFEHLGSALGAQTVIIPGAGHFGDQDEFPELIDYLRSEFP